MDNNIKKYQILIVFYLAIMLFHLSCGKDSSCLKNTGKIINEYRTISAEVNEISLKNNIDLIITQSNDVSLKVEGGENLLPYINTEISGNKLKISSDNKCSFLRDYDIPITVYLSIPNITKLFYTGHGTVTSANTLNFSNFIFNADQGTGSINLSMNSDNIYIYQHTGPSDITMKGNTNYLYLFSGENGWLFFNNLEADDVHTNHGGTGDMIVKANKTLLVELTSIGNIDYYGNPDVTVSVHTGSGELRKK
jgi:hypothetical protein